MDKSIKKIYDDIEDLNFMPRTHKTLYSSNDPNGEYRRIISGKYIIIYKIVKNQITILREVEKYTGIYCIKVNDCIVYVSGTKDLAGRTMY